MKTINEMDFLKQIDDIEIINSINEYDTFDLLSKVSCGSFFLRTTLFQFDDENEKYVMYSDSIIYLTSLYITKGIKGGNKKITFNELSKLVSDISQMIRFNSFSDDEEVDSIAMSQNTISDVLEMFRGYYIETLFKYHKEVFAKININAYEFIDDLFHYLQSMFDVNPTINGKSFEEYINNFELYNNCNFEYKGKYKEFLLGLSTKNGTCSKLYSKINPVSSINKLRSCFLNKDGNLFCFISTLITGKLPKYISTLIPENFIDEWYKNRKDWSEQSVGYLFKRYFPGAKILTNNFYRVSRHRKENDIIIDFKGNLFIVEVKAENVTPDSVFENDEEVKKSFSKQINKGIEQCNDFYNTLKKDKTIELLFENNSKKNVSINFDDYERIVKLTVVFEEMGSYLPGYFIRNKNLEENVVINFYDLFTIFDYLNNPVLIIKYLDERKNVIPSTCSVYDELVFLGIFTLENIHFSTLINSTVEEAKNMNAKIGNVMLPPNEFMHEIEIYYSTPNSQKIEFNINKLISKVLNADYKIITNNQFSHLMALLDMPICVHNKLESSFNNKNSNLVFRFKKKYNNINCAMCIKPKRIDCLRVCANYYNSHKDIKEIVIVYFEGDKTKITTIKRNNPELKKHISQIGTWKRTLYNI